MIQDLLAAKSEDRLAANLQLLKKSLWRDIAFGISLDCLHHTGLKLLERLVMRILQLYDLRVSAAACQSCAAMAEYM